MLPTLSGTPFPFMQDIEFTTQGVAKLLSNLKPNKASGPDKIAARFLKEMASALAPSLTLIFKASLAQGILPNDWKKAFIIPVYKKGDRSCAANYRPISLTNLPCKIMEHIICSNIFSHLDEHGILCDEQHGFRQKKSFETQLITAVNDFATALNNSEQVDAIFLDLSKAFDTVPHKRLCNKLSFYGIRGALLRWIENLLTNRTQQVIINDKSSDPLPVLSGVPQGSVLGPLLCICYINDIPNNISSTIRLYADDALLYRSIHNEKDVNDLQNDLDLLTSWAAEWKMTFNPKKTEFLRITNKINPLESQYYLLNTLIPTISHVKYLGVIIDKNLNWKQHVNMVTYKANSTRGFLQCNLAKCPTYVKRLSYITFVRPILDYACTIWPPYYQTYIRSIEMVQRRAARFVMNKYSNYDSVSQMLDTLGLNTMEDRRNKLRAVMVYKIIHNLVDVEPCNYLTFSQLPTRGHHHRFQQLPIYTDSYKYSFYPDAIKIWNSLPEHIVEATILQLFKEGLHLT